MSYKGRISRSTGHQAYISQTLRLVSTELGIQFPVITPLPIGKDVPRIQFKGFNGLHNDPRTSGS